MLKSPTKETLHNLYNCYTSKEYPHYFRHFPQELDIQQFVQALLPCGLLYEIQDKGITIGFLTSCINTITHNATLGILILKEHQGSKYALATFTKYISLLFNRKVHKIICSISSSDTRAIKIAEESDFIKEATLRDNNKYNGKYNNDVIYVLPHKRYKRLLRLRTKVNKKEG